MNKQSGFGLSEILISLFLASIILTSLTQLYLNNKRLYIESQKILEVNFEIQWVSDLLTDSIRKAGFTPCLGIDQLQTIDRRQSGNPLWEIKSEQGAGQSIQINRMSETFAEHVYFQSPSELYISDPVELNEHRSLIISDCEHAEVHHILKVDKLAQGQLVTLSKPLMYSYTNTAYAGEWLEERWIVKRNSHGINTLHYQLIQTEEISSLIHSLFIKEQQIHGKRYFTLVMGLDKEKAHEVNAVVRGS